MQFSTHETDEYLKGWQAARAGILEDVHASEAWRDGWRYWHLCRFMRRHLADA